MVSVGSGVISLTSLGRWSRVFRELLGASSPNLSCSFAFCRKCHKGLVWVEVPNRLYQLGRQLAVTGVRACPGNRRA